MNQNLEKIVQQTLAEIQSAGLYKEHRVLESRQGTNVRVNGKEVLNFCANNYLGLSGREELVEYAKNALDKYGYGLSSVRFICGTQTVHKELEKKIAEFLHKDDAIIFTSCWDANEAVFATLLTDADAVISDELNHASIVDGMRLWWWMIRTRLDLWVKLVEVQWRPAE